MLIDTVHAAFKDRIVAFNRVGRDLTANILVAAMVHGVMAEEMSAKLAVPAALVRHNDTFALDVLFDDLRNLVKRRRVDMEAPGAATALDKR
jgi:hypothetical protein